MELFAFDVDGTLVQGDEPLTALDVSEMNYHLAKGDAICIATGRPVTGATRYLAQLMDSPNRFAVGANGSFVESFAGERIASLGLTYGDYLKIRQLCLSPERAVYTYIGNEIGFHEYSFVVDEEYRWNRMTGKIDFNKTPLKPTDPITKIVVCSKVSDSQALERYMADKVPQGLRMLRSSPVFLEFINPRADKAEGVKMLAERLGIQGPEHIHTFGDAMNDYRMIATFDGTAMGNAVPEIKSVAKRVARPVSEDGVGHALADWFHN